MNTLMAIVTLPFFGMLEILVLCIFTKKLTGINLKLEGFILCFTAIAVGWFTYRAAGVL